jgi:hypothetical protein
MQCTRRTPVYHVTRQEQMQPGHYSWRFHTTSAQTGAGHDPHSAVPTRKGKAALATRPIPGVGDRDVPVSRELAEKLQVQG